MLFLVVIAFGLWVIVGWSTISKPVRMWLWRPTLKNGVPLYWDDRVRLFLAALLECATCFGFWTGIAVGLTPGVQTFLSGLFAGPFFLQVVFSGLFFAATNTVLRGLSRLE